MVARAPLNNSKNKFALSKSWSATQFNLNNPTASNYTIDLFNAYTLSNVSTVSAPVLTPTVVTGTISFGFGGSYGSAFNSLDNTIYVADPNTNAVRVIDCLSNTVIATILNGGWSAYQMAYNSTDNTIYVTDTGLPLVYVIDCNTNLVTLSIATSPNSVGLAYNSLNNTIYVCNPTLNSVSVINCSTNLITATIPLLSSPYGISYNSVNNTMYVGRSTSNFISVIDCASNLVTDNISVVNTFITYNSVDNTMYASDGFGTTVSVINCTTNAVTTTITVGTQPTGMAFNNINNTIYVCNFGGTTASLIDCASNTVTGTITVGNSPYSAIYNNLNYSIYVVNYVDNSVSVISPIVAPAFSIEGSTDYNQFVREFSFMPKRVRHITMIVDNLNQLNIPYEILTRDANGEQCTVPKLPNVSKNINQYQSNMVELAFGEKELILDNTTTFNQYTVLANSEVKMVIYYDEIDLSDALTNSVSVCQMIEPTVADGSSRTEAELEAKENLPLLDLQAIKSLKARDFIK